MSWTTAGGAPDEARLEGVEVDVSVVVDLEQPDTQAAGGERVDVRSPFARRHRHLVVVVEPPPSQQGVERRLGALDEGDTVFVDAEQPPSWARRPAMVGAAWSATT